MQVAQMGYQEQIPAAALFPVQNEKKSNCTPHRANARFHVRFYDFVEICRDDGACADVLRYFEMQTDWLIGQLRKAYKMTEGCIPDPDDLWIAASYRDVSEGICHSQSHTTCGDRIGDLITLGFLERRFIARAVDVEERPTVPFYQDHIGVFLVVDDQWGNYCDGNGEPRNAIEEGYLIIEWQYRYYIDKVNKALAGAFLDPPKPMKRWPPIVKRRDPVPQKGNDATAPTDCDPNSASSAPDQHNPSQTLPQGGTSKAEVCEEESGYSHDTVDTKDMSTIHTDIGMNVSIFSVSSQEDLGNSKETEAYCEAPWSAETLIGLAQARVRPGLFEISGDDADYEAAEKLMGETSALGLSPQFAWTAIDRHIMAMMDGPTWYARERHGKIKRFTLDHVARHWATVEAELKKEPWSPLEPVLYIGPAEDCEEGYAAGYLALPPVVEGSVETPSEEYAQEDAGSPGETEEDTMHQLPPPTQQWSPARRGMDEPEFDALCVRIWQCHPSISLSRYVLSDGSLAVGIEHRPNQWMPVCNAAEWGRPSAVLRRATEDAVRYSDMRKDPN